MYCVSFSGGERKDIFTGLYGHKADWDRKAGRFDPGARAGDAGNRNLDELSRRAMNAFDALRFKTEPFTLHELADKIKGREERPTLLIDYLKDGSERMKARSGIEVTKATYEKYERSTRYMQDFLLQEYRVKNFSLYMVDTEFLERYFHFLRLTRNISHNTSLKYLSFVKTVLFPAIRSGAIRDDPFRQLRLRAKPVYRGFLGQDEIDILAKLELTDPDLARKRDIFLFSCYTGLAYVDLKGLQSKHIHPDTDGSFYIMKARQKTGEQSIVPILPAAERILLKYSPTGNIRDFRWYISSNQKMNEGLKVIGARAGIERPLHMHLARHTFATTVTLSNGVPIESVSKMLGHATIKQTQHYAKVVAGKVKHDMARIRGLYQ